VGAGGIKGDGGRGTLSCRMARHINVRIRQTKRSMGDPIKRRILELDRYVFSRAPLKKVEL